LFGETGNNNTCVERLNQDAVSFNTKLNNTSMNLTNNLPGLKLVVFDIYNPLLNMAMNPVENGTISIKPQLYLTTNTDTLISRFKYFNFLYF